MAFRRSTVRLRSAPFFLVPALARGRIHGLSEAARKAVLAVAFASWAVLTAASCTSLQSQAREPVHASRSIERPAQDLSTEDKPLDVAGKVLVAVLVVGLAIAIIALPILLL